MASNDLAKWKKKFFLVFMRERGIFDLTVNPSLALDLKNLTLNPQATSRIADRIMKSNYKFWVIYVTLIAERLNDFTKATLRAKLFDNGTGGLFSNNRADYETLKKEIGSFIDAEKLDSAAAADVSENDQLPVFGGLNTTGDAIDIVNQGQPFNGYVRAHEEFPEEEKRNETFAENGQNLVIDSPSGDFVVSAPV